MKIVANQTIKMYPLFSSFSGDLLFFVIIDTLFLTLVKGLSASQIALMTTVGTLFTIIMQPITIKIIEKIKNNNSIRLGAFLLFCSSLIFTFGEGIIVMCVGSCIYYVSSYFIEMKVIILKNSLDVFNMSNDFMKFDSKSRLLYSIYTCITAVFAGYLFNVYNYLPMHLSTFFAFLAFIFSFFLIDVNTLKNKKINQKDIYIPSNLDKKNQLNELTSTDSEHNNSKDELVSENTIHNDLTKKVSNNLSYNDPHEYLKENYSKQNLNSTNTLDNLNLKTLLDSEKINQTIVNKNKKMSLIKKINFRKEIWLILLTGIIFIPLIIQTLTNTKLIAQDFLLNYNSVETVALLISIMVLFSRIVRVISIAIFTKICNKINDNLFVFLPIILLFCMLLIIFADLITLNWIIKYILITFGFGILLGLFDPYEIFMKNLILKNTQFNERQNVISLYLTSTMIGKLIFAFLVTITLTKLELVYSIIILSIFAVFLIYVNFKLKHLMDKNKV